MPPVTAKKKISKKKITAATKEKTQEGDQEEKTQEGDQEKKT